MCNGNEINMSCSTFLPLKYCIFGKETTILIPQYSIVIESHILRLPAHEPIEIVTMKSGWYEPPDRATMLRPD